MYIDYLKTFSQIGYYIYPFPTGKVYIFGDDSSIKMILFGHGIDHKRDIEKNFRMHVSKEIEAAIESLDNYLLGIEASHPNLDLSSFTKREKDILNTLKKIPFGDTVSYIKLANMAGITNGARFAGNVMAKNMFPIIIPCHRVIKTNGDIGNFSAGTATKVFLLEHEKVILKTKNTNG